MWPQYTYLVLVLLGVGIAMEQHGKPRKPSSFWATLFATALTLWLLYEGGFFKGMA